MRTSIAVACCLVVLAVRPATASIANCFDSSSSYQGGVWPRQGTVKIYIQYNPLDPSVGLRSVTGISETDLEYAVLRTLNIYNEEVGAAVKLKYWGTTTAGSVSDGILLRASDPVCSNAASHVLGALAQSVQSGSGGFRTNGYVRFFSQNGESCHPITWNLTEDSGADFVTVLLHELGHGVYAMGHPNDPAGLCANFNQLSFMYAALDQASPRSRVVKQWDAELAQQRYAAPRSASSTFQRSYRTGTTSWQTPFSLALTSTHPLYRPGSLGQNYNLRNLGWVDLNSSVPLTGGTGTAHVGKYEGGVDVTVGTFGYGMLRPVATAARPGTNEVLAAYETPTSASAYLAGSDVGIICYRRSTDGGVTYGTETCASPGTGRQAYRNGLTAAYDPYANAFLIGFVSDTTPTANDKILAIWTLPVTSGGSSPPEVVSYFFSTRSWHAPSMACSGGVNGCRLFFEAATNNGCVTWQSFGVSTSTGQATLVGSELASPCIAAFDTPSVVWEPQDSTYHVAVTQQASGIFSWSLSPTGVSLVNQSTVFNSTANTSISTAVLGNRAVFGTQKTQAWFLKYW